MYVNSLYKNPYEHSSGDVIRHIDFDLLAKATMGMVGSVDSLIRFDIQ